jgi:hypothetical protein
VAVTSDHPNDSDRHVTNYAKAGPLNNLTG